MKIFTILSFVLLFGFTLNATTYTSTASGNWSTMTWSPAGTPGSSDDVIIAAGHSVAVDDANAVCNNLSFGAATSKLNLSSSSSVLSIYGNFTNFSTTHVAFSSWTAGAKVKFTGPAATQTISGLNTSTTTAQTTFMELQIDKSSGKVTTTGTDVKLNIGTSLEIISGTFEIASTDDIQGRLVDGTGALSPNIIVQVNSTFNMAGGASHIRRANNTGDDTKRIGRFIIYGDAILTTTSSNALNFDAIDIEAGGELTINTISTGFFNPDTVNVKPNGIFLMSTTNNVWITTDTCVVNLQTLGTYKVTTSTTNFPPTFINNGTVRYQRNVLDGSQTIVDMNYYRLEISFAGDGTGAKIWTMSADRVIADSFEVNNNAKFQVSASSVRTLNLNGTLRLTSGSCDISDLDVSFVLANGITISRATGTLIGTPSFGSSVNVRYTSSVSNVTSGSELPTSTTILNNLEIAGSQGMNLGASAKVNGNLLLTNGLLSLGSYFLTLGNLSTIVGTPSDSNMVIAEGSGELRKEFSAAGSFIYPVGDNTSPPEYSPVTLNFTSGTFSSAYAGVNLVNSSSLNFALPPTDYINRRWVISQSGISSFSCDVKFVYDQNDVVGNENLIYLSKYDGFWSIFNITNTSTNELTGTVNSFSEFTGADLGATPVELSAFNVSVKKNSAQLTWKTITEVNSYIFEVQRKSENAEWLKVGEVTAAGNSNSPKAYSFADMKVSVGKSMYRLKMVDADGRFQFSNAVEAEIELPNEYAISQNYPNPFNPSTKIDYQLPFDSRVTMELYGITGERIVTILSGELSAGYYTADINANALNLASGVYIYRMTANNQTGQNFVQVKKLVLTK